MSKKTNGERAVLVTTAHKGVFFGYANETGGNTIKLRAARNCIYWPTEQKGFLGLASISLCNSGTLHATLIPPKWKGERWWIVAMIGEVVWDDDKCGALEREILGECL